MSQYTSPEGVLTPSPVTLVGAWVLGAAAFLVELCASTYTAVSTTTIAITAMYLVIFSLPKKSLPQGIQRSHRDHGVVHIYSMAITSISTSTSLGRRATSTVERDGGAELKYLP